MGKIEEVTDENEEELLVDKEGSTTKNNSSDSKGCEEDEVDSQVSDEDEDSVEEDIDFTKPISKEELLADIKSYKPEKLDDDCSECSDGEAPADFFADTSTRSSSGGLGSKRAIAFIVLFPMIASGAYMLYEVFGRFNIAKSSMQFTAAIGGAGIALFLMSNVKQFQSSVKFVLCSAWLIFLYPTYQVYHCSPIPLKNDMIGTWFSIKTESSKFLELSYVTSECFKSYQFHTPYLLSAMATKISLTVDINDLVNLNVGKEQDDIDVESPHAFNYFLLVSKRSVNKKFYKLNLITEASPKLASILKESLKLSSSEKDKKMLLITGTVVDIGETLSPMKKELEGYGYLVRPIKFKVFEVKYIERYAKLKRNNEGYY